MTASLLQLGLILRHAILDIFVPHSLDQYWGTDCIEPDRLGLNYYLPLQQIVMPDYTCKNIENLYTVSACLVIDQTAK